jgi:alkanesulfonate monooxygenase SsuD/methylene tetrahydromethanopterin reductase-like flavin-dependent oxidoreductase (luciferase family)
LGSAPSPCKPRLAQENPTLRFIIGDPDQCTREIEKYQRELGMDYLICWMHYPGADHAKSVRAMRLFAKEVMPHFRDK